MKIAVNNQKPYIVGGSSSSYSSYVTYSSVQEASIAILCLDGFIYDGIQVRATFGSTKYCSYFLRNLSCPNKDCLFYHYLVNEKELISKVNLFNIGG